MLIQQPQFGEIRTLTAELMREVANPKDAREKARAMAPSLIREGVVVPLLECWSDILASGLGTGKPFRDTAPSPDAAWPIHAEQMVDLARQGDWDALHAAIARCVVELEDDALTQMAAHLLLVSRDAVRRAGGIDALLSVAALHAQTSGRAEESWMHAASWIVAVKAAGARAGGRDPARMRFVRLAMEEKRLPELLDAWLAVGAKVISSKELEEARGKGEQVAGVVPGYPLMRRALRAVQRRDALAEQGVREQIAELPLDDQAMLVWELGCSIGYNLAEIRRQEQHASPAAPGDEDPLADWSDPFRERIYRMDALARRAVLAFINGDARTLGAVIERVRTWDDDPGRQPYELPRFQCVNKRALQVANDFFQVGDEHGAHLSNAEAAEGAMELIARHAPAEHQAAATVVLQTMRETADTVDFDSSTAHDAAGLLAFAAIAGWLGSNTRLFRSREAVRLMLTKQIRESEARALRIPQREQITEVTDDQALAFLDELYGKGYPIPRDPDERAVWELDIICLVKQHLLDTPADITTPDQKRALHEHITAILHAAAGTTPAPPAARRPSSAGGKKRPKRPKQQRRKKK